MQGEFQAMITCSGLAQDFPVAYSKQLFQHAI